MRNIECLRIWNNQQFSLVWSFGFDDTGTLENVHGRNCDANEIPQYVIDGAFAFIEDDYKVGVSIEDIAKSASLSMNDPAVVKETKNHSSLKTFEITIRYTCPNDLPNPYDWDWHTLLDIGSMESIQTSINKVETTPNDVQMWEEDTKE